MKQVDKDALTKLYIEASLNEFPTDSLPHDIGSYAHKISNELDLLNDQTDAMSSQTNDPTYQKGMCDNYIEKIRSYLKILMTEVDKHIAYLPEHPSQVDQRKALVDFNPEQEKTRQKERLNKAYNR